MLVCPLCCPCCPFSLRAVQVTGSCCMNVCLYDVSRRMFALIRGGFERPRGWTLTRAASSPRQTHPGMLFMFSTTPPSQNLYHTSPCFSSDFVLFLLLFNVSLKHSFYSCRIFVCLLSCLLLDALYFLFLYFCVERMCI